MQLQTDLFGFFEVGDKVALRVPNDYPPGPLKNCDGTLGIIVGVPFNDAGHFNVRMIFGEHERPIWRVHESMLRLVGTSNVSR